MLSDKNTGAKNLVWGLKLFIGASTEAPILEDGFSNFTVGDYHCAHS